ncbi:MAG: DNA polymerase III subunit delta [Candidatus Thiosymbion ectosymbiont of Robbea hypermnestra]|nr:DNA polymerase III subunit delta [Candidatus Thiosymbion ectosymbiont of Robbea hypermnestra]
MRIQYRQLADNLKRTLAPVYLLCGDEPLQLGEAATEVRTAARARGFEERERLEYETGFDWGHLAATADARSLFCARKLIELRLTTPRIGREGSEAVRAYCRKPAADNLLLILAPALERKELQAKWVQELDRIGCILQVRQIEGRQLVAWIEQRLRARGLRPEPGVAELLSERVEGNLPAAAQEVEKLWLLYGAGDLDRARLASAIADSARYDLFDLPDAALSGDRARVHRILVTLAAEGTAPALVLWALARELRMLAAVSHAARHGGTAAAFRTYNVWESRQSRVLAALKRLSTDHLRVLLIRCATADRTIKGLTTGDPWQTLATIADDLANTG